jgi:pentatricopeptide repeat protein
MASYAQMGSSDESFILYRRMVQEGFEPDRVAFLTIVKACAVSGDLCQGMHIHAFSLWRKIMGLSFGNSLVDMYVKCGSIEHAWKVFDTMPDKDGVSWNIMIGGFAAAGLSDEAFGFFASMEKEGFVPDQVTFLAVLKACCTVEQGKQLHAHARRNGLMITNFMGNTLIDLYIKCESLADARQVFDEMCERDTLSFTMIITGYCKQKFMQEPIVLFRRMLQEAMFPNEFTFVNSLNSCLVFQHGSMLHAQYRESSLSPNIIVENNLIDMYANCGSLTNARMVFDRMVERDVISWNTLISGYASHEHSEEAFSLFWSIEQTHVYPDCATYLSVLKACNCLGLVEYGYLVHAHIVERSFGMDVYLESCLVDMYAKCGSMNDAHQTFNAMAMHDVVAWNTIMAGYVQCGHSEEAFHLFELMERKGLKADASTVLSLLKACLNTGCLERGRHIHALTIENSLEMHLYLSVSFIDLYAKSGNKADAFKVFNMMTDHDTVAWNAIISGYAEREYSEEAIELYEMMQLEECCADTFTFVGVLKACATLAMLDKGTYVHNIILIKGVENNAYVECMLVDMYGKCGYVDDAYSVFRRASHVDTVLENAMIAAYAAYGLPK